MYNYLILKGSISLAFTFLLLCLDEQKVNMLNRMIQTRFLNTTLVMHPHIKRKLPTVMLAGQTLQGTIWCR